MTISKCQLNSREYLNRLFEVLIENYSNVIIYRIK